MRLSHHLICLLLFASHPLLISANAAAPKDATDSVDALAIDMADKAVKTAPKDNAAMGESLDTDKFNRPEPKSNSEKLDSPSPDGQISDSSSLLLDHSSDSGTSSDYDPNNLGKSKDSMSDKSDKVVAELPDSGSDKITPKGPKKDTASSSSATSSSSSKSDSSSDSSSPSAPSTAVAADGLKNNSPPVTPAGARSQYSDSLHSLTMALSMIVFSEIGDKTFLIAALMAMKHPRMTVFSAAFSSLIVMTVLSAFMGHTLPALLPTSLTRLMAAVLFLVFGIKLLREGLAMDKDTGVEEELEEVECEIEATEINLRNDMLEAGEKDRLEQPGLHRSASSPKVSADGLEAGQNPMFHTRHHHTTSTGSSGFKGAINQLLEGLSNLAGLMLSPVWVQVFAMTFFGEWGDRSQVATIAMAAGSDYWFVILGAILGHGACTLAAVLGGRLLASKISMRTVTICGAVSFLVFSLVYFFESAAGN